MREWLAPADRRRAAAARPDRRPAQAGRAGKTSGAATRPPASARPFCAETSAMTCIRGCGRVAASRIDSRTIAKGSARLPCDWQRMASSRSGADARVSLLPGVGPAPAPVRLPRQPDPRRSRSRRPAPTEEAPSAAGAGRPRLPRPLADWTASMIAAARNGPVQSKAKHITRASPALASASAVMRSPRWPGP